MAANNIMSPVYDIFMGEDSDVEGLPMPNNGPLEDSKDSNDGIVLHDLLPLRPQAVADPDSDDDYVLHDLLPLRHHAAVDSDEDEPLANLQALGRATEY